MDGNECCTGSAITREKLTLSLWVDAIYANASFKMTFGGFKVKAYHDTFITDSVQEETCCRDNQSIRDQRQENGEVWLPEWIGTS